MSSIQIYADGMLAYDNIIPDYAMQSILLSEAVNKGGTCTITMLPGHPAYAMFPAFRTLVEVYKDNKIRWRGRPLPLSDNMHGIRTVVCEGELCWFNDVIIRPYRYETDPESILRDLVAKYNAIASPNKQFEIGNITVKDPNNYLLLYSESAQTGYDVLMKLIDRCGGYIFFETRPSGKRSINWYAELPYRCTQPITFGSNLLDYNKQPNLERFATRIIPYGAKNPETGKRLQIDVDGKDYLQNDEAVALRGVIEATAIWDDVTERQNLYRKAADWLTKAMLIPYSIRLAALDLSKQGMQVDAFAVGQRVQAESPIHGLSDYYDLTELQEDLCDPRVGGITLGREVSSLIGADLEADKDAANSLDMAMQEIHKNEGNLNDLKQSVKEQITSAIQTCKEIIFTALERYVETSNFEQYQQEVSSQLAILANEIRLKVTETTNKIESVSGDLHSRFESIEKTVSTKISSEQVSIEINKALQNGVDKVTTSTGFTFNDKGLKVTKSGSEMETVVTENGMTVNQNGEKVLAANNQGVDAKNLHATTYLIVGKNSRFENYGADRTGCFWIGGFDGK